MWLLGDYVDARAEQSSAQSTWLQLLIVALPAVTSSWVTFSDSFEAILAHVPFVAGFVRPVLAVAAAVVALTVVTARERRRRHGSATRGAGYRYRFKRSPRLVAKVALPALVLLATHAVVTSAPNGLTGNAAVGGFVCDGSTGMPVTAGAIEAVAGGRRVSTGAAKLDDLGFFYLALDPWSPPPSILRLRSSSCGDASLQMDDAVASPSGCPATTDPVQPGDWRAWLTSCH
jgi:hypothetical protein